MSVDDEKLIRIQRIQRKFQEDLSSEKKLKYLKYLSGVAISLEILKDTSIGKTVNLMRKEDGVVGQIAGELVSKWKEIAASEYGSNVTSSQQINDKKLYNKNKIDENYAKHSVNNYSNHSLSDNDNSYTHSTNGTLKIKREGNSSSSPSKPKISEEEKTQKLNHVTSTHSNSKKRLQDQCGYIEEEHSTDEIESIVPTSKLNDDRLHVRKEELVKNEKKTKENSPCKSDTNSDVQKKKQCKSFEEMLMMPVLPTKKKKKKRSETSKLKMFEEPKLPMLPTLPDVELPQINTVPLKMFEEPKLPMLPTLPDVELPQINTVPVYRPNRPLPNISLNEEMKKKVLEPPPPALSFTDITSRKTKSVMYTGKKCTNGVVMSLYQMCMRVLIENVDALYETGGVPFSVLEPLLTKCNPSQLERLEYYNPHFIQDTDGLWKKHCLIEFKGRRIDDDSVAAWRDMYKELYTEREEKLRRLSSKISFNQQQKVPERSVKLAFVASAPKPSVQILRKQNQKKKWKEKKVRDKDEDSGEKQREIRERMMKEQKESSVHVPFTKVPKRERCSKRPPSSLSTSDIQEPKKQKPREEELGSSGPAELMPAPVPKKKKGKNPMMLKALKLLNKQKSRMGAQIMRK